MATALQDLIALKVGRSLGEWLRDEKAEGKSWADMAFELRRDHGIRVTSESLRRWSIDEPVAA